VIVSACVVKQTFALSLGSAAIALFTRADCLHMTSRGAEIHELQTELGVSETGVPLILGHGVGLYNYSTEAFQPVRCRRFSQSSLIKAIEWLLYSLTGNT